MLLKASSLALLLSTAPSVHAWGIAGHEMYALAPFLSVLFDRTDYHVHPPSLSLEIRTRPDNSVATIAQIFLTPTSRATLCEILPASTKCHLAPIAGWADRVRNPYTGPLHYVNGVDDWPADHCTFGEKGWLDNERNVLVGIYNSTRNVVYLDG